jgi:rhodanese-related sulfurtransferase
LDTRKKEDFVKAFIPGAIFIGIDDTFAPWVGTLITDLKQPILLVADEDKLTEVVTRLARVGYDNPIGYLKGGMNAWQKAGKPIDAIDEISATDFATLYQQDKSLQVLDARRKSEYDTEHLVGVTNFPLDFINRDLAMLKPGAKYFIHCAGGYRSVIMASILKARGYKHVVNIQGGYKALCTTGLPRTQHQEIKTEL